MYEFKTKIRKTCRSFFLQTDNRLREHLASAIASCCGWGNNAFEFGRLGTIHPLVNYMGGTDKTVHRTTARALHMLSTDPYNCITLHQTGVVGVSNTSYFSKFIDSTKKFIYFIQTFISRNLYKFNGHNNLCTSLRSIIYSCR